jgi:hypothetical protein
LPKNEGDFNIEEKIKKPKIAGRIVACPATIHAAIGINNCPTTEVIYILKKN